MFWQTPRLLQQPGPSKPPEGHNLSMTSTPQGPPNVNPHSPSQTPSPAWWAAVFLGTCLGAIGGLIAVAIRFPEVSTLAQVGIVTIGAVTGQALAVLAKLARGWHRS